jgi:formamidopyrimidine-DNA glycosylase
MPELPEVETVRADLESETVGRRIVRVDALGARTFRRYDVADLVARTTGRVVVGVDRRGKYLLVRLDSSDVVVIHLRMSGQLLVAEVGAPRKPHTHAVFSFGEGAELRFVDPRTFGEVFVTSAAVPELGGLGIEPLDPLFDHASLARRVTGRRVGIKALLLDQRVIAGIGNMYADEILWRARIRYDRRGDRLSRPALRRLHDSIVTTLLDAIAHRGSSLADEQYRDLYGAVGAYQSLHNVYDRAGLPCPRCGRPIRRVRAVGRGTYFCPTCQR